MIKLPKVIGVLLEPLIWLYLGGLGLFVSLLLVLVREWPPFVRVFFRLLENARL